MTLRHSEPFHFLEFRHGPMSTVSEKAVVVGMLSNVNHPHEAKVLSGMKALGGTEVGTYEREGVNTIVRDQAYLALPCGPCRSRHWAMHPS